jgi:DNA-binding GntR family transcriptional regulator
MRGDDDRPANAAEGAYLAIRDDILSGALQPDERLTEVTLAERLGISRTPVREAVKRLLFEGFLTRAPGEGLRVTGLNPDEVQQIFRIRTMLEGYGARRAAELATPDQIAELQRLAQVISDLTPACDEATEETISRANADFHRIIMQAAQSPRLSAVLSLAVNLGLVLRTYRMFTEGELIRQARHHHEIVQAIAARDPDWADAAMSAHILAAASVTRGRAGP